MSQLKGMQKQLSEMIGQTEDPNMDDVDNPDESLLEDEGYTAIGDGVKNEAKPDAGDGGIGMDDSKQAKKQMLVSMMKKKTKGY